MPFEPRALAQFPPHPQAASQQPREAQGTLGPPWPLQWLGFSLNPAHPTSGGRTVRAWPLPTHLPDREALAHKSIVFLQEEEAAGASHLLGSKSQHPAEGWNQPRKPGVPSGQRCQVPLPRAVGRGQEARRSGFPTPQSRSWPHTRGQFPGGDQQEISRAPGQRLPSQSSWRPLLRSSPHSPWGGLGRGRRVPPNRPSSPPHPAQGQGGVAPGVAAAEGGP